MNVLYTVYLLIFIVTSTYPQDTIHFFRAPLFPLEPRLERPYLTSIDIKIGGGHTSHSRNQKGKKVPLFDIYGAGHFGHSLSINGSFSYQEYLFSHKQNFDYGLFSWLHIPLRTLSVKNISVTHVMDKRTLVPENIQFFADLLQINMITKNYAAQKLPYTHTHLGDIIGGLGWTYSYQNTTELDFIDFTFLPALLFPTGSRANIFNPLDIPTGYNGHWGICLNSCLAFGFFEWLTIGCSLENIFFLDKKNTLEVKLDKKNIIILPTHIHKHPIWSISPYVKADHFVRGLSFGLGYSFSYIGKSTIDLRIPLPFKLGHFSPLRASNFHTLHFLLEYDFTKADWKYGPRIGIEYNYPVAGKRIFLAAGTYGNAGLEIVWYF